MDQEKERTEFEGHVPGGFWFKLSGAARAMQKLVYAIVLVVGVATLVLIIYMLWMHGDASAKAVERQTEILTASVKHNADVQVIAIKEIAEANRQYAAAIRELTCVTLMSNQDKRMNYYQTMEFCKKVAGK